MINRHFIQYTGKLTQYMYFIVNKFKNCGQDFRPTNLKYIWWYQKYHLKSGVYLIHDRLHLCTHRHIYKHLNLYSGQIHKQTYIHSFPPIPTHPVVHMHSQKKKKKFIDVGKKKFATFITTLTNLYNRFPSATGNSENKMLKCGLPNNAYKTLIWC